MQLNNPHYITIKLTSLLLTVGLASAISSAQANLLIAYNPDGVASNFQLGLFSDTGTLLQTYATGFSNTQRVTVDGSGNGYMADAGTGIYKYNLTTAAGGVLFNQAGYTPLGLGFNSNRPGEILISGIDNTPANPPDGSGAPGSGNDSIARIDSTTGAFLASFRAGGDYTDIDYDSGTGQLIGAIGIQLAQTFDPVTLAYGINLPPITGNSQTTTSLNGVLYYGLTNGQIRTQSDSLIYTLSGGASPNAYDITNDGTNLIAVDYTNGIVSRFTTGGTLINSFDVGAAASGVAFTAVPEPSTYAYALMGFSGLALLAFRRRRAV